MPFSMKQCTPVKGSSFILYVTVFYTNPHTLWVFFFFFLFPVTEKAHPEDAQTKNYPNRKCRLLELALLKAH